MTMKGYSILSRSRKLEPHNQMQFSAIHKTTFWGKGGSYSSAGDTVRVGLWIWKKKKRLRAGEVYEEC